MLAKHHKTREFKILSRREEKFFLFSLLLSGYSFRLLGDVYLAEFFLALFSLKSIVTGRKVFFRGQFQYVPLIFLLWFLANLFSSLLNGKSLSLTLISVATVVITGLSFRAFFEFFTQYPDKILKSLFLFAVGRLIGVVLDPLPYTALLPWKFGYGEWVILLVLSSVAINQSIRMLWFFIPILIIISITNEARTLALLTVGAAFISFFGPKRRLKVASLIAVTTLPIIMYYGYLEVALGGHLSNAEINRARLLAESDLGPLAARKEFIFSTRAFFDSPVLGYGFEPEVKREIIEDGYQELISNGIKVDYAYLNELPMHSFIMSAFVQGGIFAGIFWIFAIFNSLKAFFYTIEMQRFERPLAAYLSLALIERILFSPFGAYERLTAAIFISYILTVRKIKESNLK